MIMAIDTQPVISYSRFIITVVISVFVMEDVNFKVKAVSTTPCGHRPCCLVDSASNMGFPVRVP